MNKLFTLLCFLSIASALQAKQIDEATAKTVGTNFIQYKSHSEVFTGHIELQRAYVAKFENMITFYVFNVNNTQGFIIVSADDVVEPVLGYSDNGAFVLSNVPPALIKLLNGYKKEISAIVKNNIPSTPALSERWRSLIDGSVGNDKSVSMVSPLIQTQWSQSPYYNDLCPFQKNSYTVRCVTGCPATAMAQIMKYWNYPTTGKSFFAYSTANNGILSANFGKTTYNWSNMPNTVSAANTDVATLMYHCGVAVKTEYGAQSSAYVVQAGSRSGTSCEDAYKRYFKYDNTTIQGLIKSNFSDTDWINKITYELDNNRPIQYVGYGNGGGHTWVLDGYNGNLFHMNWGWGGLCDGNFQITALNPTINNNTTGAGLGQYNSYHEMVIGIQPPTTPPAPKLALNSSITLTSDTTSGSQAVAVNVDIKNVGDDGFDGEYCVAVFDEYGEFITIIDSIPTNAPLGVGADYSGLGGLTFSDSGMVNANGNYDVQVYYKPTGEDVWELAGDIFFPNEEDFYIETPPNDIRLNSAISVNPQIFVQGQPADVSVDIFNGTADTLVGDFSADLYDLDGNFIETIGAFNESNGILPQTSYGVPVTFSSTAINAAPGTYTIAINAAGYLCGDNLYANPITIDIVAPDVPEDTYEPNDDPNTASALTLDYSISDSGSVSTNEASIPYGSSYDYYEVYLPPGYDYFVDIMLNDNYYAEDGQYYTLDGIVSYATDTSTYWSDAYDDIVPTMIVTGGTTLYLVVSPYFYGDVGTYNLTVDATRFIATSTNNIEQDNAIKIYPNPAKDNITVDVSGFKESVKQIKVYSIAGQEILSVDKEITTSTKLSLNDLSEGIYIMKVLTNTTVVTKQLVIKK